MFGYYGPELGGGRWALAPQQERRIAVWPCSQPQMRYRCFELRAKGPISADSANGFPVADQQDYFMFGHYGPELGGGRWALAPQQERRIAIRPRSQPQSRIAKLARLEA